MSQLRSKEVVELGIRLVAHLDREDDLLASWMSHYIAELIDKVNHATPDARDSAQEACFKAILELWRHRSSFPIDARPFASLEPILRTLASLDMEQTTQRYYAREREDAQTKASDETKKWLDFARDIDNTARLLIRVAIRSAVASTTKSTDPWVEIAKNSELNDNIEGNVLEFVRNDDDRFDEAEARFVALHRCAARIDSFLEAGDEFAEKLRAYAADVKNGTSDGAADEEQEDEAES